MLPFIHNETWVYRMNPSFKLLVSMALFVVVLFTHNINLLIHLIVLNALLVACFSGHPFKRLALLSLPFLLLFVSSSTSMIFFGKGETVWLEWGIVSITLESFVRGLHIGLKTIHFALIGLLFALTTKPVLLFYSLMQQLKLPPKYAYSFMAAMRLLPIMIGEFQTLRQALKVRGVRQGRGLAGVYGKLKMYTIPLLAQSIRRAQRIAVAMEAKRFTSDKERTYYYKTGFSANDLWFVLYWTIAIVLAVYAAVHYPVVSITDVRHSA